VFLRVLEYYAGILFLTTNRVGAFDEAFRSRIHLSLYYPPLDEESTMKVWKLNIKRTNDRKAKKIRVKRTEILEYAREHFNLSVDGRWNGRQIRNAFQIAIALAEYDTQGKKRASKKDAKDESQDGAERSSRTIVVRKHHFEKVAQASVEFDKYLRDLYGQSTSQRAFEANHRHDDHGRTINPQGNPFVRGMAASHHYSIPYNPTPNPSEAKLSKPKSSKSKSSKKVEPDPPSESEESYSSSSSNSDTDEQSHSDTSSSESGEDDSDTVEEKESVKPVKKAKKTEKQKGDDKKKGKTAKAKKSKESK
jgi:hypothetical protein